jgi:hypothetical protein
MVVMQRNEVRRSRFIFFLTIGISALAIGWIAVNFSGSADLGRLLLVLLGVAAAAGIVLSLVQLYAYPRRSQVLLLQTDEGIVIATNALHEGFKLRFLRDILGEHVVAFSDEERQRWKPLEADGFYATLHIRDVRKLIVLRLCMMIFDDVFYADSKNRWEHHDSSCTAEPSFSKRQMPRLTSWKSST